MPTSCPAHQKKPCDIPGTTTFKLTKKALINCLISVLFLKKGSFFKELTGNEKTYQLISL